MSVQRAFDAAKVRPFVEGMAALLAKRKMTIADFRKKLELAGHGSRTHKTYRQMQGYSRPRDDTLTIWAEMLREDLQTLIALRDTMPTRKVKRTYAKRKPPAAGEQISMPYLQMLPPPAAAAQPVEQPQFSMVVDQAGRATFDLHLRNVPLKIAVQAMAALQGAGLISGGEE